MADNLESRKDRILAANEKDVAGLADPVGEILKQWTRPNVTADSAGLALESPGKS